LDDNRTSLHCRYVPHSRARAALLSLCPYVAQSQLSYCSLSDPAVPGDATAGLDAVAPSDSAHVLISTTHNEDHTSTQQAPDARGAEYEAMEPVAATNGAPAAVNSTGPTVAASGSGASIASVGDQRSRSSSGPAAGLVTATATGVPSGSPGAMAQRSVSSSTSASFAPTGSRNVLAVPSTSSTAFHIAGSNAKASASADSMHAKDLPRSRSPSALSQGRDHAGRHQQQQQQRSHAHNYSMSMEYVPAPAAPAHGSLTALAKERIAGHIPGSQSMHLQPAWQESSGLVAVLRQSQLQHSPHGSLASVHTAGTGKCANMHPSACISMCSWCA